MIIYIIGFLITMAFAYQATCFRKEQRLLFAILSMLPLTIISAIRYNVGTDYMGIYVNIFKGFVADSPYAGSEFEPGFRLLNRLISYVTKDYQWLFVVTSVVFGAFTFSNIYRQSRNVLLSLFFYMTMSVYFMSMNIVRQFMALSIAYAAIPCIQEKKLLRYTLIILFASLFHVSVLLLLPLYWAGRFSWNRRFSLTVAGIGIAASGLLAVLLRYLLPVLFGGRYIRYLSGAAEGRVWIFLIAFAFYLLTLFVNPSDKKVWICVTVNLVIGVMTWFIPVMERVSFIVTYGMMLYMPSLFESIPHRTERTIIKCVCMAFFVVYIYYSIAVNHSHNVLPYQTIFQAVRL